MSYAPDGNLEHFDTTDIALASEWEGDPDKFVAALIECGSGSKAGFIDADGSTLHDWDHYAGKYVNIGGAANHARWHVDRGVKNPECVFCYPDGLPPDSVGDPSEIRSESRIEEKEEKRGTRRATRLPSDWAPTPDHIELANSLGSDLALEASQFSDFHTAKGSTFKDWNAAFRTWLRNDRKFREQRTPKNDNGSGFHAPNAAPA